MDIAKLVGLPFRYHPWRPRHLRLILADAAKPAAQEQREHKAHLAAAIAPDMAHGLATSSWLARDVASAPAIENGRLLLPAAGGLGLVPTI